MLNLPVFQKKVNNSSKIKRELGWEPSVTVEEGLRRTIAWYADKEY